MKVNSRISGFYKLPPKERLARIKKICDLTEEEAGYIYGEGLSVEKGDKMIENVVGTFELPLGIATNFKINDKDYLIPMTLEEPSVVAAASNAARIARTAGGFKTDSDDPIMIGQIQVTKVEDAKEAAKNVLNKKDEIIELANQQDPILVKFGGGCRDVEVRVLDSIIGDMVVVHLLVDVRDAMGANAVNTMAEKVTPMIEELTGGKVVLRILSNLADRRLARARAVFPAKELGGEDAVDAIIAAYALADADPYRASTHNKGIMNGISSVVIATGNDFRAIEAGAHTFASVSGTYKPLTRYSKNADGDLEGEIELPMAVGLVGGATKVHPVAKTAVKIIGVKTASELAQVMAAVGLAQNFAALRALATEGIQKGHMKLHARNVAVQAGAEGSDIDAVAGRISADGKINVDYAREVLEKIGAGD